MSHEPASLDALLGSLNLEAFREWGLRPKVLPEACTLLMHVHVLPSFVALVRRLIELGFAQYRIVVIAKSYSQVASAVKEVKALGAHVISPDASDIDPGHYDRSASRYVRQGCNFASHLAKASGSKRIILVDDGGILTETWHRHPLDSRVEIISIQQTSSGLSPARDRSQSPFSKIDVARSAAKSEYESRIIALGVLRAVDELGILEGVERIGIAGVGRLGRKLAERLVRRAPVAAYDLRRFSTDSLSVHRCDSAEDLLARSDLIFGCTGRNWLSNLAGEIKLPIELVSCSSRDIEFQDVLQKLELVNQRPHNPFDKLSFVTPSGVAVKVHNGGFPINFDRVHEWEAHDEISVTRALILGAILQALATPAKAPWNDDAVYMLEPILQQFILAKWLATLTTPETFFGVMANRTLDWIAKNSHKALRLLPVE